MKLEKGEEKEEKVRSANI